MINPANIIGGTFEAIEGLYEEASGNQSQEKTREMTAQDVAPQIKEGPATAEDLKNMQEQKKKSIEKTGVIYFNRQVSSDLAAAQAETASQATIDMQRSRINTLLNLQDAYQGSMDAQGNISIYHQSEADKKQAEAQTEQEKPAEVPNPAKQPSALEGAFEGRSGTQGSGTSNLSSQAVG